MRGTRWGIGIECFEHTLYGLLYSLVGIFVVLGIAVRLLVYFVYCGRLTDNQMDN